MAFPVVETQATSISSGNETSHTVDLPTGIASGDLVVVFFAYQKGVDATWPSGWTELFDRKHTSGDIYFSVGYREADGTEGTTITVDTSSSSGSAHNVWRISGAKSGTAPQFSSFAEADSLNPDSPSLTPTGGALDWLWLTAYAVENANNATGFPTNYSNGIDAVLGGGGNVDKASAGSSSRQLNASSENPGAFTLDGDDLWQAVTIAIEPAGAASPQTITPTLYSDPDTFGAHNVAIEQFLDTTLYADADTFGSHSVTTLLSTILFQDPDTFGTHQLNLTLSQSIFTDPDTFGAAQINQSLITTLFSDPDSFGSHSISAVLTASLFQNVSTFGSHTVSPGTVTLTTTLYNDPDTFGSHTVSLASQVLQPTLFTDPDTFGTQQINLVLNHSVFVNTSTFGSPQLNLTLLPALYDDTDVFGSHTVVTETFLTTTLYSDPDSFGAHEVQHVLLPGLYVDADTFGTHTIQPGTVTLTASLFVNTSSFGSHFVDDTGGGGGAGGGAQARKRYRIKLRRNFT